MKQGKNSVKGKHALTSEIDDGMGAEKSGEVRVNFGNGLKGRAEGDRAERTEKEGEWREREIGESGGGKSEKVRKLERR